MDEEKRSLLLKLGYFPVTDDFWAEQGMPEYISGGWDWAMRTPCFTQSYMPYHETYLEAQTPEQAEQYAERNLVMK